jgi:hypothetical protein
MACLSGVFGRQHPEQMPARRGPVRPATQMQPGARARPRPGCCATAALLCARHPSAARSRPHCGHRDLFCNDLHPPARPGSPLIAAPSSRAPRPSLSHTRRQAGGGTRARGALRRAPVAGPRQAAALLLPGAGRPPRCSARHQRRRGRPAPQPAHPRRPAVQRTLRAQPQADARRLPARGRRQGAGGGGAAAAAAPAPPACWPLARRPGCTQLAPSAPRWSDGPSWLGARRAASRRLGSLTSHLASHYHRAARCIMRTSRRRRRSSAACRRRRWCCGCRWAACAPSPRGCSRCASHPLGAPAGTAVGSLPRPAHQLSPLALQGGPGCMSMVGCFFENGPFSISKGLKLEPNPGGRSAVQGWVR